MKLKLLFLFAFVLCLSGISAAQVNGDTPRGYMIGPGDVLTIKVVGEKDFEVESVTVDEDGKIQIPFSDGITAQCQTEKGLRDQIVKVYSKYIRNPQVGVYVRERKSRPPVAIYGEIRNPQRVDLTRRATLRDLLAFSGGVTEKASGIVQVTRTQPLLCAEDKDEDWKNFNAADNVLPSRIYSLGSLREANPVIYPGDIIDVQKAPPIYVIGEVMRSGELVMPEGGLPMMQAIAMASGTTREAKMKEIKIYRRKPGTAQPEVISVNYDAIKKGTQKDMMLEPYDIVEVGKSKKSIGEIMLDIATGGIRNAANTLPVRF